MKLSEARFKAMTALRLGIDRGTPDLTAEDVARIAGHGSAVSMTDVLRRLSKLRCIQTNRAVRPFRYRITPTGLLRMGSFPAATTERTSDVQDDATA